MTRVHQEHTLRRPTTPMIPMARRLQESLVQLKDLLTRRPGRTGSPIHSRVAVVQAMDGKTRKAEFGARQVKAGELTAVLIGMCKIPKRVGIPMFRQVSMSMISERSSL